MTEYDTLKIDNDELEPEPKRKIFIGSLSYRIDDNTFRDYWTKFGTILDATILRDREGRSRGFGFVTFDNSSSVDAVMNARPHTLDNRDVLPKRAVPRDESHKADMQLAIKKLYLGGIKEPLTENDLKDYFSKYGNITDVIVMKNRDGQYRGFGFIEFDDYDPVDKVILDKNHFVCGCQLDVQKAQSKDGPQRSGGNMRSRQGPPSMSRSNYNSGYDNYQQDMSNNPYGQMPSQTYNGFNTNLNRGNGNTAQFGQGYSQDRIGGPMRRGNMNGGNRGYGPYNGRGGNRGGNRGRGGRGGGGNQGPSWTSWD